MRIMAIAGSVRRGNTYAMVEAACHALNDCDVELLHLKNITMDMCDGCLTCDDTGECHYHDEMTPVVSRVAEADGLVLGTPTRWGLLSGELKVFLDRLNPLAASQRLAGKKAIILAVGQCIGDEALSIRTAVESVKTFCTNSGIQVVDTAIVEGCLGPTDLITHHPEKLNACKASARRLLEALISGSDS